MSIGLPEVVIIGLICLCVVAVMAAIAGGGVLLCGIHGRRVERLVSPANS